MQTKITRSVTKKETVQGEGESVGRTEGKVNGAKRQNGRCWIPRHTVTSAKDQWKALIKKKNTKLEEKRERRYRRCQKERYETQGKSSESLDRGRGKTSPEEKES